MRCQGRLLLALLATVGAFALGVASSSAGRLSVSNQTMRITWNALRFNEGRAQCAVTLEGSLHSSTFAKSTSALVGHIVGGRTGTCAVGSAVLLTPENGQSSTVPWHVRYGSFSGTLPAIASIRLHIVGFSYRIVKELEFCLYASTAARPALLDLVREGGSGALTSASFFGTEGIPLVSGNIGICEPSGLLGGSGSPTIWGSATRVTLTLI
jgi:hypothetical protein